MSWADLAAPRLENEYLVVRPVTEADRQGLRAVALDPEDPDLWTYYIIRVDTDEEFDAFFAEMLADQAAGRRVVFHITDKASGRTAGSMSYGNMSERDLRLEIGWAWLAGDFRGTWVNPWTRYLLIEHAFETLGAERVEFKTDVINTRSRSALRNIGAVEEGVLRSFSPMPGGRRRDCIYYSMLRREWPGLKPKLAAMAKARAAGAGA